MDAWLDDVGASTADRTAIQSLLQIAEFSGIEALSYCIREVDGELFALEYPRKGSDPLCLLFHKDTFGVGEATFLFGAKLVRKELRPLYAVGTASENLRELLEDPGRRARGRIG